MAAPSYLTDLTTVNLLDTDVTPAVGEPTGSTAGTTIATETDHFVVGTACVSKIFNATGVGGLGFLAATAQTLPTDGAVYTWQYWGAPNAIETKANGGMQVLIGNTAANYRRYYTYGRDTVVYGGWKCFPVNPTITQSATQGTPNTTYQYFGVAANVALAVARGYPLAFDAIRIGRGSINMANGSLADGYATFSGAATTNDTNTTTGPVYNRWGILSFNDGSFQMQGRLGFGNATVPVDFKDSNKTIVIQNTEFVTSDFNKFEILNAASNVSWTGITISSLSTVSRGNFTVTNNANVTLDTCTFTDLGNFTLQSNTSVVSTVFRRCGPVTVANATLSDCLCDRANSTTAVIAGAPSQLTKITGSEFISDGTGYAIELTGTAANTSLSGVTFTGYAATNGTTGNEAIFVNIATGAMTISITGGGNTPSIRTAGANVTIQNAKSFTVTNIRENSEVRILRQSDSVELGGAENISASPTGVTNLSVSADPDNAGRFRVIYDYGYTVDVPIFVVVFNVDYQPIYQSTSLKSTDTSLLVTQIADRQYDRGTIFNPS